MAELWLGWGFDNIYWKYFCTNKLQDISIAEYCQALFQPWGCQGKARLATAWVGVQLDTTREFYFQMLFNYCNKYVEKYKQIFKNTPVNSPN